MRHLIDRARIVPQFSPAKNQKQRREKKTRRENELIVDSVYQTLPSLPIVPFQIDYEKSLGIERSQSRRHTSFAPSKARRLPCSRKALPVDDIRICVSTRTCHSFRDKV